MFTELSEHRESHVTSHHNHIQYEVYATMRRFEQLIVIFFFVGLTPELRCWGGAIVHISYISRILSPYFHFWALALHSTWLSGIRDSDCAVYRNYRVSELHMCDSRDDSCAGRSSSEAAAPSDTSLVLCPDNSDLCTQNNQHAPPA